MQIQIDPNSMSAETKNQIIIERGLEDLKLISKSEITKSYLELDNDEDQIK